ncbi:cell division protein PerM [Gordonia soli]|nr:DUF6350 family protein [Gordonia soli]
MPTPSAADLAARLRQVRRVARARDDRPEGSARELVVVAFAVPALTLAVSVVVVLAVLLLAGGGLSGVAGATGALWLAIHQVPVSISGVTIGALPLLPTLTLVVATARSVWSAYGGDRTASEALAVVLAAVGGPLLVTAISLAVVMDGGSVLPVQTPNALVAFAYTLGLHGAAAVGAVLWRERHQLVRRFDISPADRRGLRLGVIAAVGLFAAGAVVVLIRLLQGWRQVGELIATGNDFDGYLGLTVLSVLYLPNLVVGAAGVLVGADAHVGASTVDLMAVRGGAVPPVPSLAVLPGVDIGVLGALGFVVPIAVAGLVAWRSRDVDPIAQVRTVGVAAAVAASIVVITSLMAGGQVGELGDAGVNIAAVGVFTLGWIAVVGLVVALVHASLPGTRARRQQLVDETDFDDIVGSDAVYDDDYLSDEYEYGGVDYDDADYDDADYGNSQYEHTDVDDADYVGADHDDADYVGADHDDDDRYGDADGAYDDGVARDEGRVGHGHDDAGSSAYDDRSAPITGTDRDDRPQMAGPRRNGRSGGETRGRARRMVTPDDDLDGDFATDFDDVVADRMRRLRTTGGN